MKIHIDKNKIVIGEYTDHLQNVSYTYPTQQDSVTFLMNGGIKKTIIVTDTTVNGIQMTSDNIDNLLEDLFFLGEISTNTITGLEDALHKKADLVDGVIPSYQLPSYVDDIIEGELVNDTEFDVEGFIIIPENRKIYVDIVTNKSYRWGGSVFVEISKSIALGTTANAAFRGDYGQTAYEHSKTIGNPHNTTKTDIGLGNVNNTSDINKPVSTAQQTAINSAVSAIKIGGRNIVPSSASITVANSIGQAANRTLTVDLIQGETYTLSYKSTNLVVENDYPQFYVWALNDWATLQSLGTIAAKYRSFVWNKPTGAYTLTVYNHNYPQKGVIDELKIEKGSKATDWLAAPEDIQAQIKALSDRITALGG